MYRYASEIDEKNIIIQKLCSSNVDLIKDFICGNDYIDEFLKKKALYDRESTTHLIIEKSSDLLLGFFSLSASGISFNMSETDISRDKKNRFNISAVEIDFFAVNKPFQHMFFDEISEKEKEEYFLSDILFEKIIEFIVELREYIGFRSVVLYSVPNSKNFNKPLGIYERFGFISFKDYMEQDRKRFLEGCIPLFKDVE